MHKCNCNDVKNTEELCSFCKNEMEEWMEHVSQIWEDDLINMAEIEEEDVVNG